MATFDLDFEGWNPGSLSIIVAQIVEYLENHPIYDPETGYTYSDLVAGNNLPAMVTDTELTQNEKENAYAAGYRFVYDTSLHEAYFLVKVNGILSVVDFPGNDFLDKADVIISTASGAVASFTDGADGMPMESVVCSIEPVQDLSNGDPSPTNICPITGHTGLTLVRSGKNICGDEIFSNTNLELITDTTDDFYGYYGGSIKTFYNSFTLSDGGLLKTKHVKFGNVTVSADFGNGSSSGSFIFRIMFLYDDGTSDYNGGNIALSADEKRWVKRSSDPTKNCIAFSVSTSAGISNMRGRIKNLQVEIAENEDVTASGFEAYQGTTVSVDWTDEAGTVYGGTLDVVSGVLTVTDAEIASYAGETLPSTWISDRDVYAEGTTPTTGAQVVYKLATPLTYTLTPTQEIDSLLGTNVLWHNANGNTSVSYRADTKLYIDAGLAGKQDTLTFDSAPVQNSTKPVTSGGLYTAFSAKQDTLTFDSAPVQNSTKPVTSGGLYTAFSAKQNTLTFDSAPVQNSTKPVTSGGLYTAFSAKQDALVFDQVPQTDSTHPVTSDGIKTALDLKADLPILEVRSYDFSLTIPAGGVGYTYTNEVSGYTCIGCRAVISSSSSPLIEVSCPVYISSQVQARILNIGSGSSNDIVGTMYFYFIKDSYIQ